MQYKNIVILTGAGVSAESGLGTFRDKDGLWTKYDLNDVATPEGFARNPELVLSFYNARRRNCIEAAHNAAHQALAKLEAAWEAQGGELLIVTQNVDDLHEQAGSKNVIHMHGELKKVRCENCRVVHVWSDDVLVDTRCPSCTRGGHLRPHIVWFGEMPFEMERIYAALGAADLFVSIGTSGNVYPAAGFVSAAREAGARTMELNLEPSENAYMFDDRRYGPASKVVSDWAWEMMADA